MYYFIFIVITINVLGLLLWLKIKALKTAAKERLNELVSETNSPEVLLERDVLTKIISYYPSARFSFIREKLNLAKIEKIKNQYNRLFFFTLVISLSFVILPIIYLAITTS